MHPSAMGVLDFSVIALLLGGIWQFRSPRGARQGNLTAAFSLLAAFVLVLFRHGVVDAATVLSALLAGSIIGFAIARAVTMIQIPSMVAFQHGAGGVAAFLVSYVELTRQSGAMDLVGEISGVMGLAIGSLTFSGSMVASAKLANRMRQTPQRLAGHDGILLAAAGLMAGVGAAAFFVPAEAAGYFYMAEILVSACFGILFSIRIGGADMPVLISFLNATAGLAAALCGMVIENRLLIAFGATVAASGSILTHVMCRAMNRSLFRIFRPRAERRDGGSGRGAEAPPPAVRVEAEGAALSEAARIMARARSVIVVPGYGMARARAQARVAELAEKMTAMGKEVKYAIHPVAGRMPGHMNVLLAEAGVDYDMLVEMDAINPAFAATDLVLVVGACDVVNPAAIDVAGTPISGMPILMAHQAKNVICCNFDRMPGYSGVENPLYDMSHTIMLLGDAEKTVQGLLAALVDFSAPQQPAAGRGSAP